MISRSIFDLFSSTTTTSSTVSLWLRADLYSHTARPVDYKQEKLTNVTDPLRGSDGPLCLQTSTHAQRGQSFAHRRNSPTYRFTLELPHSSTLPLTYTSHYLTPTRTISTTSPRLSALPACCDLWDARYESFYTVAAMDSFIRYVDSISVRASLTSTVTLPCLSGLHRTF